MSDAIAVKGFKVEDISWAADCAGAVIADEAVGIKKRGSRLRLILTYYWT